MKTASVTVLVFLTLLFTTVLCGQIDISGCASVNITGCALPSVQTGSNCVNETLEQQADYHNCLSSKMSALVASKDCSCRISHFLYLNKELSRTRVNVDDCRTSQIGEPKDVCSASRCERLLRWPYTLSSPVYYSYTRPCTQEKRQEKEEVGQCLDDYLNGELDIRGCGEVFQWQMKRHGRTYLQNLPIVCSGCQVGPVYFKCNKRFETSAVFKTCQEAEEVKQEYACVLKGISVLDECQGGAGDAINAYYQDLMNIYNTDCQGIQQYRAITKDWDCGSADEYIPEEMP